MTTAIKRPVDSLHVPPIELSDSSMRISSAGWSSMYTFAALKPCQPIALKVSVTHLDQRKGGVRERGVTRSNNDHIIAHIAAVRIPEVNLPVQWESRRS